MRCAVGDNGVGKTSKNFACAWNECVKTRKDFLVAIRRLTGDPRPRMNAKSVSLTDYQL